MLPVSNSEPKIEHRNPDILRKQKSDPDLGPLLERGKGGWDQRNRRELDAAPISRNSHEMIVHVRNYHLGIGLFVANLDARPRPAERFFLRFWKNLSKCRC